MHDGAVATLEAADGDAAFIAAEARLSPCKPDWAVFPETGAEA